jgi:hypothetical protein
MRQRILLGEFDAHKWPDPTALKRYFVRPVGQNWVDWGGTDSAALHAEGLYGTEHLTPKTGRVDVHLHMCGNPDHGVHFAYGKWDGRTRQKFEFSSKGDLRRLRERVYSLQGDPVPIGLFVPFPKAYLAVKEFIETGGELPKSIEWIAAQDIPADAFARR